MQCKVRNWGSPLPRFSTHLPQSSPALQKHFCLFSFTIDLEGPCQQSQVVHHQTWVPLLDTGEGVCCSSGRMGCLPKGAVGVRASYCCLLIKTQEWNKSKGKDCISGVVSSRWEGSILPHICDHLESCIFFLISIFTCLK